MVYFGLHSLLSEGHDPGNHICLDCDVTVQKFTHVDGLFQHCLMNFINIWHMDDTKNGEYSNFMVTLNS